MRTRRNGRSTNAVYDIAERSCPFIAWGLQGHAVSHAGGLFPSETTEKWSGVVTYRKNGWRLAGSNWIGPLLFVLAVARMLAMLKK